MLFWPEERIFLRNRLRSTYIEKLRRFNLRKIEPNFNFSSLKFYKHLSRLRSFYSNFFAYFCLEASVSFKFEKGKAGGSLEG